MNVPSKQQRHMFCGNRIWIKNQRCGLLSSKINKREIKRGSQVDRTHSQTWLDKGVGGLLQATSAVINNIKFNNCQQTAREIPSSTYFLTAYLAYFHSCIAVCCSMCCIEQLVHAPKTHNLEVRGVLHVPPLLLLLLPDLSGLCKKDTLLQQDCC